MNTDGALFGYDLFGEPVRQRKAGPLAERFEFPPFSVLDARAGEWQERKAAWLSLGIKSELGRTDCEVFAIGDKDKWAATKLSQRLAPGGGCWRGGPATNSSEKFGHHTAASQNAMSLAGGFSESHGSGTSVFDPVLTEMAYRWFSPEGAQVVDPFRVRRWRFP